MNAFTSHIVPADTAEMVSASTFALRWAALEDAGTVVAGLARIDAGQAGVAMPDFPARIARCETWRADLAEHGTADLTAIMEPGLTALLRVHSMGGDTGPAALALWHEFASARAALLGLLPDSMPSEHFDA